MMIDLVPRLRPGNALVVRLGLGGWRCEINFSLTEASEMAMLKFWYVLWVFAFTLTSGIAQEKSVPKRQVERAKRPIFSERDWDGIYFEDLFQQGLVGPRPENFGKSPTAPKAVAPLAETEKGDNGAASSGWSMLISSQTIEDEVKKSHLELDALITTSQKFKTENDKVRESFSFLATLFAIIAEYDDNVRWKEDAPSARDAFAQAAANAQTSSDEAFASARTQRDQLAELIRGGKLAGGNSGEMNWTHWTDRIALMKRLDTSFEQRLKPWTSSMGDLNGHAEEVLHEANIVAAIGQVLIQTGLDEADDEEYAKFAQEMSAAAIELQSALQANQFDAASSAVNRLGKACNDCHEAYR